MDRSWLWDPLSLSGPRQGAATGKGSSSLTSPSTSVVKVSLSVTGPAASGLQWLIQWLWVWLAPRASMTEQRADDRGDSPFKSAPPFLPAQEQPVHPPHPRVFLVINGGFLFPESWDFPGETSIVN